MHVSFSLFGLVVVVAPAARTLNIQETEVSETRSGQELRQLSCLDPKDEEREEKEKKRKRYL